MRFLHLFLLIFVPRLLGPDGCAPLSEPMEEVRGIDVSHHQKQIEWDTVAATQNVHFAFVKATEGADFTDTQFCRNWEELDRLGIRRGAYHFFRAYGCGYDQAMHFLSTVEMQPGDLAPVLDVERIDGMPPEILLEEMRVWLQTVERHLRCKPIIYTNQNFYEQYLAGLFDNHPLWIARYSDEAPVLTTGKAWQFWQYSHRGTVGGIATPVDMNVFSGGFGLLDQLCWRPAESTGGADVAPLSAP